MTKAGLYAEAINRFRERAVVTISAGITCAYLGDERNLREFLVADEVVKQLRQEGHTVLFYLFDDSLDPLNFRQLRVAVNKDERMIERCRNWCGSPISHLPDPWECHGSYAEHFEQELLTRLGRLGCHPVLVSTARLYERGMYAPYVRLVLDRYDEVMAFLGKQFPNYHPETLYHPLCPHCVYIDEAKIAHIGDGEIRIYCSRCELSQTMPLDDVKGKLSWKLDCALRWALFHVDAEPFSKAYLEPQAGSFFVAQALSKEFFGGHDIFPLHYGQVKMDREISLKLMDALPPSALRAMMVERPSTDIHISHDSVMTAASRHEVLPELTYLDFVKQLLPMWLLTPDILDPEQRDLMARGMVFSKHFLETEVRLNLPSRELIEEEGVEVLKNVRNLLKAVVDLRGTPSHPWEMFQSGMKRVIQELGPNKKPTLQRLRLIVRQDHGLPVTRFLYLLPLNYLEMLVYILDLHLSVAERYRLENLMRDSMSDRFEEQEDPLFTGGMHEN